jgi:prepilin-type N-terminal cleavage/methylation domain-containing protein
MRLAREVRPRKVFRSGFTLIELLVVMLIISILVALTASAVAQVMMSQQVRATETTLQKMASGLDQQWQAVIDQAREEYRNGQLSGQDANLSQAAGGNADAARNLWVALRLQQEFPTTFAAARTATTYTANNATVTLQPKPVYVRAVQGLSPDPTRPTWESGVCLVMALSLARRGHTFPLEDAVGAGSIQTINGARCVVDSWGTPLAFTTGTFPNLTPDIVSAGWNRVYGDFNDLHSTSVRQAGARGDQ